LQREYLIIKKKDSREMDDSDIDTIKNSKQNIYKTRITMSSNKEKED